MTHPQNFDIADGQAVNVDAVVMCPRCGKKNIDNWPLSSFGGEISLSGCQECWEKECDAKWWDLMSSCLVDSVFEEEFGPLF